MRICLNLTLFIKASGHNTKRTARVKHRTQVYWCRATNDLWLTCFSVFCPWLVKQNWILDGSQLISVSVSVLVMKAVLTPEWVNNQVFSLVLNEQCLAVPLQWGTKWLSRPFTLSAPSHRPPLKRTNHHNFQEAASFLFPEYFSSALACFLIQDFNKRDIVYCEYWASFMKLS